MYAIRSYYEYVPAYYKNEEKCFIAPEDISIPKTVDNTQYTVVAGLDLTAADPLVSIKAIFVITSYSIHYTKLYELFLPLIMLNMLLLQFADRITSYNVCYTKLLRMV